MIATIVTKTQYGRMGQGGISRLSELDSKEEKLFAHSVQEALTWVKNSPGFENAIVDDLMDGRYVFSFEWLPFDNLFDLIDPEFLKGAEYERKYVVVYPVNTIYENTPK